MSRIIGTPNRGIVRPGEGPPIDQTGNTKLPNAAGQPPRTVNLAPRNGQPNAPMRPRSPLPFPANPRHVHGEMRARPTEVNQLKQQQEAERFKRAQLVHAALPNGGESMKRLRERASREHPATKGEKWRARLYGTPKPMDGKRRDAFETLVRADVLALAKSGRMEPGLAAGVMRGAVMDGTLGQGIREKDRQLLLAVLNQMATEPYTPIPARRPMGAVHPTPARPPMGAVHPTPARPPMGAVHPTPARPPMGAVHPTPAGPPMGAVHPTPARPPMGAVHPTPARPPMGAVHPTPWPPAGHIHPHWHPTGRPVQPTPWPPTWANPPTPAMPATTVPTLPAHIDRLYKRLKLRVTFDTLPAFTNAQVLEKAKPLGSGAFNTVFAIKLRKPDGSAFDGVFKPLDTKERGWVAGATGIPTDDPQIAMRNIATVSYAKKLGLDVVPDTRVALIDTGNGIVDPDLGLIMERARGKPAAQTDASILARPDVCAEVTKLQLLDHLTGQGDRHSNNYFINIEPNGRAKVMGIDNDQCFGKNLTDPAGIQQLPNDRFRYGFRGTGLPPVVDTEMARAINALTPTDIRSMLGDKLSEDEIQAAIARHRGVKDYIAHLRAAGRVIEPAQWGQANVQQLLNAQNSYLGRERAMALARENAPAANNNW